jgi:hypothetical protein
MDTYEVKKIVQVEHPTNVLSTLVEGGFFDHKTNSPTILVVIPTMAWSKFMMRARERNMWRRVVHLPN